MKKEVIIDVGVNTKEAVRGVDDLTSSMDGLKTTTKETSDKSSGLSNGLKAAGQMGATGLGKVAKGFKGVGMAIKAAGIGLVISAFLLLKETLGGNQKVLDFVNTAFTAFGIVINDLFDFISSSFTPAMDGISNAIDTVKNAFADIPGTLVKVKDAIVNNIEVRFNALIDTVGFLGSAIKKVFSGDFSGALDDAGEAGKSFVDGLTGIEGSVDLVVDGVTDLVEATLEYTDSLIENSKAIENNKKQSELLELQQTRVREQSDRDAERQRQIRDDYTKTIDERIAANEALGLILEKQEKAEKKTITDRIGALQREQDQLGSNFERRKEIFALNTELIAVEAQQEGFRSEQKINALALVKEQEDAAAAEKLARDEEQKVKDIEAEVLAEERRLLAHELKISDEERELEELQALYDAKFAIAGKDGELRTALEEQLATDINDIEEKHSAKAKKLAVAEAKFKKDLKQKEVDNAINGAASILNSVASMAEEGSGIAKAAAIGQATMDTYKAGVAAYAAGAAMGPAGVVMGPLSAGLAVAAGVLNIKKIASTKTPGKATVPVPNVTVPSAPSAVGNASASVAGLNSDTLFSSQSLEGSAPESVGDGAGVNQQPIQAIVLESDITSTQNTITNFQEQSQIG